MEDERQVLASHQKRYVMGLSFSENLDRVVLIKKIRPGQSWDGFLLGLGGKVEPVDFPPDDWCTDEGRRRASLRAMEREFEEESGVHVSQVHWNWFCSIQGWEPGPDREGVRDYPFRVDNYWNVGPAWRLVYTHEKELVKSYCIQYLNLSPTITWTENQPLVFPNVTWLLPMALSLASGREKRAHHFGDIIEGNSKIWS